MFIGVIEDVESEYDVYIPSRTNYKVRLTWEMPTEILRFDETWQAGYFEVHDNEYRFEKYQITLCSLKFCKNLFE